jgi:hypothetical protein
MFQVSNLRYFGTIFAGRNEHGRLVAYNPEPMSSCKQLAMAMRLPSNEADAMGIVDDFFEDSDGEIDAAARALVRSSKDRKALLQRASVLVDMVLARHVREGDVAKFEADKNSLQRFADTLGARHSNAVFLTLDMFADEYLDPHSRAVSDMVTIAEHGRDTLMCHIEHTQNLIDEDDIKASKKSNGG